MCLRYEVLALMVATALLSTSPTASAQSRSVPSAPPWQEARRATARGTRISIPAELKKLLRADPQDCLHPTQEEQTNFHAYRIKLNAKGDVGVAVRGRGTCFCSVTGNCTFWVFSGANSKYKMLLDTDMVQDFGFLRTETKGVRDFVVWSHDSAFRTPASLYRFDGERYQSACGWEEQYEVDDSERSQSTLKDPKIVGDTCISDSTPQ